MRSLRFASVLVLLAGAAGGALKPLDADIQPAGNKAAPVYKIAPQGHLKINLYFPSDWKSADRRPVIVFFFGGSCAVGSPAQFTATAEYFATRGLVAASAEFASKAFTIRLRSTAPKMAKAPYVGCV